MSLSHLIILGVIALIVIPPDKLPELARQLAKFIYELKRSADQIMGEIKQEAYIKPDSILDQKIKDLHKAIVNGDKEKIERLQKYIDYFYYGIK